MCLVHPPSLVLLCATLSMLLLSRLLLILTVTDTAAFIAVPSFKADPSVSFKVGPSTFVTRLHLARGRAAAPVSLEAFKPETSQAVLGLAAQPIMWWSLFTLKTTGCGLPAGPAGLYGALEGVSYLIVAGFVLASLYSKVRTGSGLPAGPGGLLGLAEGLSFLTAVAGLAVLGFQVIDYGYIPNAVPVAGGVCS